MTYTETERVSCIIKLHGQSALTERAFFAAQIAQWLHSPERRAQLRSDAYYRGEHDILRRERQIIGENGKLVTVDNLPNNRIVDNQFALMVDQKSNYLVGKPITFLCKNSQHSQALKTLFNKQFHRLLHYLGQDALKGGLCWLYPVYDADGRLVFQRFPAHEILPFWADDDHTVLDCAVRFYEQEVWDGMTKTTVQRVELFQPDGIHRYLYQTGTLLPDVELGEHSDYFTASGQGYNWTKIPLIPFKANQQEIPLLNRVKSLQDGINTILSDWENHLQEDSRNTILVLVNYDGEDLGEFRHNLAQYGAVKVSGEGGVNTLQIQIDAENYEKILTVFKKKLIENARGFDAKDERMSSNPNQMNIQSMYADVDLDANGMETEFQAAFEQLLWFVDCHLCNTGQGDFTGDEVTVVFNRDMPINESEAIENCTKSVGILSNRTIVAQHPWTLDPEEELQQLKREQAESMQTMPEYDGAFAAGEDG